MFKAEAFSGLTGTRCALTCTMNTCQRAGLALAALLTISVGAEARADAHALVVREEIVSGEAAGQAQVALARAGEELGVELRVSPVPLRQLALAVGCEPSKYTCLVRLAGELAGGTMLIQRDDPSPPARLTLTGVSARDGRVYRGRPADVARDGAVRAALGAALGLSGQASSAPPVATASRAPLAARRTPEPPGVHPTAVAAFHTPPGASTAPSPALPALGSANGPKRPGQTAAIVAVASLTAAALLATGGVIEASRSRDKARDYDSAALSSRQQIDAAEELRGDAARDARIARGLLGSAGVAAVVGISALIWRRVEKNRGRAFGTVTATPSGRGAMLAYRAQWGGRP